MPEIDGIGSGRPRVSVIIPAYNAQDSIGLAVASALAQTESRCEVIVIDDASQDATAALVTRIAGQTPRVRLLRNASNLGPAGTRNRGIEAARGEWIGLLDADDEYLPDRLSVLLAEAERQGADMVADNLLLCPADTDEPPVPMIPASALPHPAWLSAAGFVASNIGSRRMPRFSYGFLQPLIRRSFLERHGLRYDERNRFGEDFLLYLACLMRGARWWVTPEPMYRYVTRAGTLTDVQSAADLQRIRAAEQSLLDSSPVVAADPALADALRRHKAKIERFYYYRAFTDALKQRKAGEALRIMRDSPKGARYILQESLVQGPRVALKALRGGFRARQPEPIASADRPQRAAQRGRRQAVAVKEE